LLAIRRRSALRYSASVAVSALAVESSAGQSPPITQGGQSTGELKVGIASDSLVALRRRWRAVFRPKIATGEAYRPLPLEFARGGIGGRPRPGCGGGGAVLCLQRERAG